MDAFQPARIKIEKITLNFGNLQEVSVEVQGREILAIIGPIFIAQVSPVSTAPASLFL
jgi:hypothetical protein